MKNKRFNIGLFIIITIILTGSISVIGLLQSTEKVSTSGIIVQPPPSLPVPPTNPLLYTLEPPEPTVEIDVFCDLECTEKATSVIWGSIEVGYSALNTLYIKNIGDSSVTLTLNTQNWNPVSASDYLELTWNYDGSSLNTGEVQEVTLMLTVDPYITGIENFSFDIILVGEAR